MEYENEAALKEVHAVEEASNGAYTQLIKEAEVTVNGELLDVVDGSSDNLQEADSSPEAKAISHVPESKTSKSIKKSVAAKAEGNVSKEKPFQKGVGTSTRLQKALLSKSPSFPTKLAPGDNMRKSTDGHLIKKVTKNDQDTAKKTASMQSISRLIRPTKSTSQGMDSKDLNANGARSFARQTSLTQKRSSQQEVPTKPSAVDEPTDCSQSELESDTLQRAGGSGFSSRLEQRAERRKEFFSKMEERIHAKEMEKTNLQAKSKESQEAEIKQLRKSLTFKATPMPNFYKEPPLKPELKKIPITRPISPKLGKHKSSSNNSEGAAATPSPRSSHSPRLSQDSSKGMQPNGNRDTISSKTSVRKSYDKLKPQQNTSVRAGKKMVKPKPMTAAAAEGENDKAELLPCEAGITAAASEDTPLDITSSPQVAVEG